MSRASAIGLVPLLVVLLSAGTAHAAGPHEHGNRTPLPVRGIVRALEQATLSTELVARVLELAFREGERFARGDVLVRFDCRRHVAELASAEAQHREMEVALSGASQLVQFKAGSRQDLEIAKARADRTAADVEIIRARLDGCTIRAPYDGRVAERLINEQELSSPGRPMLTILADGQREIDLIVPSAWLGWLLPGTRFSFAIDETRRAYPGIITRLGAAVDTVSQTIKIHGRLDERDPDILPGMSGSARFLRAED